MKQRLGGGFNPFSKIWVKMQIFLEWMWKLRKCFKPPPRNPPVSAACGKTSPETLGWRVAWDAHPRNNQKLSWEHYVFETSPWLRMAQKHGHFKHFSGWLFTNVYIYIYYKRFFPLMFEYSAAWLHVCNFFGKTKVLKVDKCPFCLENLPVFLTQQTSQVSPRVPDDSKVSGQDERWQDGNQKSGKLTCWV